MPTPFCCSLGPCQGDGCARPACEHEGLRPHALLDPEKPCEAYVPSAEQAQALDDFEGGGGSSGGGGASGHWLT